jgi:hypothetical protein
MMRAKRAGDSRNLLDRLIGQADDGPDLGELRVMAERHVREEAQLGFQTGKQLPVEGCVDEVADQRRVAPQSVGKGIVFQALLLQIEQESCRGEAHIEEMGDIGRAELFRYKRAVECRQDQSEEQGYSGRTVAERIGKQMLHAWGLMI